MLVPQTQPVAPLLKDDVMTSFFRGDFSAPIDNFLHKFGRTWRDCCAVELSDLQCRQ